MRNSKRIANKRNKKPTKNAPKTPEAAAAKAAGLAVKNQKVKLRPISPEHLDQKSPPVFLTKHDLLMRLPVSFATIWNWMRQGLFPLAYNLNGKSVWLESEVDAHSLSLPRREYKEWKGWGEGE